MATCAPRPLSLERTSAGGRFTPASSARTKPSAREAFWVDGIVCDASSLNPGSFCWAQPHNFQQANHPFTFFAPEVASGMQHSDDAFACHDMRAAAAPTDTITAGAPLAIEWYLQANHPGDCALYISYDTDLLDTPRRWIKLKNFVGCAGDAGMLDPTVPPSGINTATVTLPDWLPSCDHCVIRWEWCVSQSQPCSSHFAPC